MPELQLYNRALEPTSKPGHLWRRGRRSLFCFRYYGANIMFGFSSASVLRPISHFSFALHTISSTKKIFLILFIGSVSKRSCHFGAGRGLGCLRNGLKLCKARSSHSVTSNPSPVSRFSSVDIANLHVNWLSIIGR